MKPKTVTSASLSRFALGPLLAAMFVACYGTDVVKPPEGPGTAYPCGLRGVSCGGKPLMCCPQNHICGFNGPGSRCTAGYCCYDGDDWPEWPSYAKSVDGGTQRREPIQQTTAP